jgi:hypothetical protein
MPSPEKIVIERELSLYYATSQEKQLQDDQFLHRWLKREKQL